MNSCHIFLIYLLLLLGPYHFDPLLCPSLHEMFPLVQLLSCVQLSVIPWTAAGQASLSITNSRSFHKLKSIESVMPSNHLILCLPLSSHLQSFPRSGSFPTSQFFTSGGQSIGSFRFSISPSNEYSGLICLRMDWLDLLAVQGTLKSLLQHHSSKASIFQRSASYLSLLFFGTLHSNGVSFLYSFAFSFSFLFSSQQFVRPPQTIILPFCISFSWGWC